MSSPSVSKLVLPLLVVVALSPGAASGNSMEVGGHGGTLMPLRSRAVAMVSEHVVLRARPGAWEVSCDFTFHNTSAGPVSIRMGFPFPGLKDPSVGVRTPPRHKAPRAGEPLVWDFAVQVRGEAVRAERVAFRASRLLRSEIMSYRRGYAWPVSLAAGERVPVRVTYLTGTHRAGEDWSQELVRYVLRTGSLWRGGRIGRSRIEVRVEQPFELCAPPAPKGSRRAGSTLSWDLRRFRPGADLSLCLVKATSHAARLVERYLHNPDGEAAFKLAARTVEELVRIRNLPHARHGYTFRNRALRRHFERQWWYRPRSDFRPALLTKQDRQLIGAVRAEEQRRR